MEAQWTLVVEGLGRIERAEVRIHPFMLFVGENNSGKSYLASLLWGLVSLEEEFFPQEVPTSDSYADCQRWLQDKLEQDTESARHTLNQSDHELFFRWLNENLSERKNLLASRIFNLPEMKVGRIELKELRRSRPLTLHFNWWSSGRQFSRHSQDGMTLAASKDALGSPHTHYWMIRRIAWRVVMGELGWKLSIYLPASRTGFVLLYKFVISQLIDGLLEPSQAGEQPHLTNPAVHFLRQLAFLRHSEGRFQEEASLLEQGSLQGHVALESGIGVNELKYHPSGNAAPLSMALSSSLVTELAPIILLLRHTERLRLLVLEEPEAHLHPKVQRLLAQTLVRLVRKGLPVWVTTHSENFCQQINNFLKLSQHPNRAELAQQLGYSEQDYLEPSEAVGVQFVTQGATSTVTELEKSASGFTMPTFNEELMALSRETLFLQREAAKPNEHD